MPTDEKSRLVIEMKQIIKHHITKIAIVVVTVYGLLFVSKYFINGYAEIVKATRNLKDVHKR
jgi:hypothetical protein